MRVWFSPEAQGAANLEAEESPELEPPDSQKEESVEGHPEAKELEGPGLDQESPGFSLAGRELTRLEAVEPD